MKNQYSGKLHDCFISGGGKRVDTRVYVVEFSLREQPRSTRLGAVRFLHGVEEDHSAHEWCSSFNAAEILTDGKLEPRKRKGSHMRDTRDTVLGALLFSPAALPLKDPEYCRTVQTKVPGTFRVPFRSAGAQRDKTPRRGVFARRQMCFLRLSEMFGRARARPHKCPMIQW